MLSSTIFSASLRRFLVRDFLAKLYKDDVCELVSKPIVLIIVRLDLSLSFALIALLSIDVDLKLKLFFAVQRPFYLLIYILQRRNWSKFLRGLPYFLILFRSLTLMLRTLIPPHGSFFADVAHLSR